jgi:hypothetical protein
MALSVWKEGGAEKSNQNYCDMCWDGVGDLGRKKCESVIVERRGSVDEWTFVIEGAIR